MTTPKDIMDKVDEKERNTKSMRERMDRDFALWNNELFTGAGEGYQAYTTNSPKTLGRKGVSLLSGAAVTYQVFQGNDDRSTREADNAKERFILGNLKANDERLTRIGQPPLRSQISWHLPIRGWTCGRALLNKRGRRSWTDATPWDPREVMWEFGHDGLLWVCHKYVSSVAEIRAEYGGGIFKKISLADGNDNPDAQELMVRYDYYDTEKNIVLIPEAQDEAVKDEEHGMITRGDVPTVPAWVVPSSLQPFIVHRRHGTDSLHTLLQETTTQEGINDALATYGDSIYADNRNLYDDFNFMMSIRKELAARSRKPVFGIRSRDGIKLVEGDPFVAGSEIPLADGEELIVYDFIKSAPDIDNFQAILNADMDRGGFSPITFGDSPLAISGFAMQTLKAGDAADKINPFIQAEQVALKQITNMWADHYLTGAFPSMELSGVGNNRKWFSARITPEDIEDLPEVEVTLVPILPEKDAAQAQLAQLYRQPGPNGMPIVSDYYIRENTMMMQDSDMEQDAIFQEMGAMAHPLAQLETLTEALAKRGDPRAKYYFAQWQAMIGQNMAMGLPPFIMPGSIQPPAPGGPGLSPDTLPRQGQGLGPPQVVPQAGPNVPPGTPRPGAQNGRERNGVGPIP